MTQPTDLFQTPSDDPLALARCLDRIGDLSRINMRKGKSYRTIEHRAADMIRWYVKHGCSSKAFALARQLLDNERRRAVSYRDQFVAERVKANAHIRAFWYVSYALASLSGLVLAFVVWIVISP